MKSVSYARFKGCLGKIMDASCNNQVPIRIRCAKKKSVVIMPLSYYQSIEEYIYLLKSPENARRLLESIDEVEQKILIENEKKNQA